MTVRGTKTPHGRPIHPWLLSVFPILHLYAENLGIVTDGPVPISMGISLAAATLLVRGLRVATGSLRKAALIATLVLAYFYSYGHLAAWLESRAWAMPPETVSFALLAVLAAIATLVWRRPDGTGLSAATTALNVMTIVLLVTPAFQIAAYFAEHATRRDDPLIGAARPEPAAKVKDGPGHADIYYVIVDGYSSNQFLLRKYAYDNSRFTGALEELGFFIAYDSKSNYGATLLSLGSSLNMKYLPEKPPEAAVDDMVYLRMSIADSDVARFLLARGYTYIYMLSGFLLPSRIADVNLDFGPNGLMQYAFSETKSGDLLFDSQNIKTGNFYKEPFSRLVIETTLLRLFADSLEPLVQRGRSYTWSDTRRFFATLEELKAVADRPEATFAFVHLMEPHGPVQFRRDGSKRRRATGKPTQDQFFAELEFVNEKVLDALRTILARSSTPPIIIVQADHGSNLGSVWTEGNNLTHFEILNALHLPGDLPKGVTRDLSPINTFGVLLRSYFGIEYEEQEVKLYDARLGYKAPFKQWDVTSQFR